MALDKLQFTKNRKIFAIFALVIVSLSVNSFLVEPNLIENHVIEITDTGINMTIAFLSDFQRRDADPAFVQRVVDMINEKSPDLVLLGGDYVEWGIKELPSIEALKNLESIHGVYGVMGNHDYGAFGFAKNTGGDTILGQNIIAFLESTDNNAIPITILQNEKAIIQDKLTIIGLDDLWANLRDEQKAYADKESVGYRILLSHNQEELQISKAIADLYLFGHTHCGQLRLPVLGSIPKLLGFSGEYDMGHYVVDDVQIYTTCGLAPAPRFLNPPEITMINLS